MELIYLKDMTPLKAWRKYKGYKQKHVAEKLGVSQSALLQIEKAKNYNALQNDLSQSTRTYTHEEKTKELKRH